MPTNEGKKKVGRPATGRPSRKKEIATPKRRATRAINTSRNRTRAGMQRLVESLGMRMTKKRITELHNLRQVQTTRYVTQKADIKLGLSRLQGLTSEYGWEPSCGTKGISRGLKELFRLIRVTTIDVDPKVKPDIVADYADPSKYAWLERPEFIIFRYACDCSILEVMFPRTRM